MATHLRGVQSHTETRERGLEVLKRLVFKRIVLT